MYFITKVKTNKFKKDKLVRFITLSDSKKSILVEDAEDINNIGWFMVYDLYHLPFHDNKLNYKTECQLLGKNLIDIL
jgi:hypothetical protein